MPVATLGQLRRWGTKSWHLKGDVMFSWRGHGSFLIKFKSVEEAEQVLHSGTRRFADKVMQLERWSPKVGWSVSVAHPHLCWVRAVGLLLHCWSQRLFKKLGDICGGFVTFDEDTANFAEMQWAHLLVKTNGSDLLGSLQLVMGATCYVIQLCWEAPLWVSTMVQLKRKEKQVEGVEDDDAASRTNMGVESDTVGAQLPRNDTWLGKVATSEVVAKAAVQCAACTGRKEAPDVLGGLESAVDNGTPLGPKTSGSECIVEIVGLGLRGRLPIHVTRWINW